MERLIPWLGALLLAACAQPPPEAPAPVPVAAVADTDAALEAAHDALAASHSGPLRWLVTPYYAAQTVTDRYGPLADLLAQDLDWPVEFAIADDYQAALLEVVRGQADVALLSPYATVQALKIEPRLQVFASHIATGRTTYSGYLVTRADSPIRSVAALRGQPIGFVSRQSTSGWLYPAAALLDAGIDPLHDVNARFYGDHDRVLDAVLDGEVAAAATYSDVLMGPIARPGIAGRLRVIARTGRIPYDAYVARADLSPAITAGLAASLGRMNTTTADGRARLASIPDLSGFFAVDASHYAGVQQVEQRVLDALGGPATEAPATEAPPEEPP